MRPQVFGREGEAFDAVSRPRPFRSPDAMSADLPHIAGEAGQGRGAAGPSFPENAAARLPVIKPTRQARHRGREVDFIEEASEPIARVRPSPPPGSPADSAQPPARSINERPRVRPHSKSELAGEAIPAISSNSRESNQSPLPRVTPQRAGAPASPMQGDTREPLPHAPADSVRERLGQFPPAQSGHPSARPLGTSPSAHVITAPPSVMAAVMASQPAPVAPASPPERAALPERAPPEIDMNALVNQVQRKIMRNLAIERSRKGGVR